MLNLANKITLIRIAFVIPVIILLYQETQWACVLATTLFVLASITDYLDGHIARKEKMVTSFGKFLDPLADKLLICSVLIMLSALGWVPAWISIIIIAREQAVTGLRAVAADEGVVIAADKYGKMKTIFQIVAVSSLQVHYSFFGLPFHIFGMLVLYIALILTVYSGINYFVGFYKMWNNEIKRK